MKKEKVVFTKEKETLLIPLYGKALESKKANPVLLDRKAEEIMEQIEYDFQKLHIPQKTNVMMGLRGKQFDQYTLEFMQKHPEGVVLHLGCGLDCRYFRIGENRLNWYELDFPEVIDLKKHFIKETKKFHFIASSAGDLQWIKKLPNSKTPVLVLAEGLFMYLHEEEIRSLLKALMEKYTHITLVFDAFSKLTARQAAHHPSLKKTGASIHWGIDDAGEMEKWAPGIRFVQEWFFSDSPEIVKLNRWFRFMFRFAGSFTIAKKAHRVLVFELNKYILTPL